MPNFHIPTSFKIKDGGTANRQSYIVGPLERGYGVTIGNGLRRVLLSSMPGAAITSVRMDNVLHEFATIKGVKEDVCGQCHDGTKKLARTHERMHGHIDKGSGIDCLYCHDFTRATSRGLCSPCDPACDTEFADTNPDYPHVCP